MKTTAEFSPSLDILNFIQLLGMVLIENLNKTVLKFQALIESEKPNEFISVVNFESTLKRSFKSFS